MPNFVTKSAMKSIGSVGIAQERCRGINSRTNMRDDWYGQDRVMQTFVRTDQ